ncbi:aminotransferase class V-fold PLP-dependent enzyme [Candidatus Halobonum tyrrellensis]|uniref:aminotransferase class V-fold PLP-dependent enzyme n=1 Tax=Candidatus Halobonum tyrrellensis TaxID=1431545 RepID=UPI001F33F169|nr:aminotransferase class V-fold PLP-dependent enzyme [Candidatus Halobonum tyrrellensis]
MTTPADLREAIPVTDEVAYFNTGATGPAPDRTLDAAAAWEREQNVDLLAETDPYPVSFDEYDACRERVAAHLGVDADDLALTESTADGVSAVVAALELGAGDVAVTTDLEHPAGTLPLARLERRHGVEVRVVDTDRGRVDTDAFAAAVEGADLALFSSLSWTYGTRLPVAEMVDIAHDAGAFALVDAVQSPGQGPVDFGAWGADAVAASGHKWLLGPWGTGILHVAPDAADRLHPAQVTYRSVADPAADPYELAAGARRFERGTASIGPFVGLRESLDLLEGVGMTTVRDRIETLAARLVDALPDDRVLGPSEPESGLVPVDVADPEATVERLRDRGLMLRDVPDPAAVRASVHAFNTETEVDRLAEALAAEPRRDDGP